MSLSEAHWGFVVAAYAITAVVLVGLTLAIAIDFRRQRRVLAGLEAEGARRRPSAAGDGDR